MAVGFFGGMAGFVGLCLIVLVYPRRGD